MPKGMSFDWNPQTIDWYRRAEAYNHFYEFAAQQILPLIPDCRSLCDLGCGLGLADMVFAGHIPEVTCMDIDETALRSLREAADREGLFNLKTVCRDCEHPDGMWDVIFVSFFGTRMVKNFLPCCKKLFMLVEAPGNLSMGPSGYGRRRKTNADETEAILKELGVSYVRRDYERESGQPFDSPEEAAAFVRNLAPAVTDEDLEAFLAERVVKQEDEQAPYFLARMKRFAIFEVNP